jgi:hypothetical protein
VAEAPGTAVSGAIERVAIMLTKFIAFVAIVLAVTAACSDNEHTEIVDKANIIPKEVFDAIPTGSVIARNESPDFNGDGTSDFILAYGPIANKANSQIGVLVDVDGVVTRFERSDRLTYSVEDATGDDVDDLIVTWPEDALKCRYATEGDAWVALDGTPCQRAQIQP